LALSPFSLATALTMTSAGARGETAEQMKKVLHQSGTIEQALDLNGKLLASYQDPELTVTLRIANRLFVEKAYTLKPSYLDIMGSTFGAPIEPVDFRHDFDASRQRINAWIGSVTQDRIKDLLPEKSLDGNTCLVLANAIYFLGGWSQPFSKQLTAAAPFHLTASESRDVPTMHHADLFRFAATDGVKLLEMFYKGRALAMTLVLPDQIDGLDAVEARLSPATLDAWLGALAADRVDIALPRFEIDPADSLALADTLEALGMPFAFNPNKANFTGIATPSLYIDKVFHKAFVKLDEKGTEAVAATAVVGRKLSAKGEPPPPKVKFHADHPFLFFLRDVRSGMILFMGRVTDPTAK
jgi:serpin B